jgi:hypothetical protein
LWHAAQKERSRQTFLSSARYAGFIDSASGRLAKPGISQQKDDGVTPPADRNQRGGDDGGEPPKIDPIIQGLLSRLPRSGDVWPEEQRKLWLQLLEGSFRLIYKDKTEVACLLSALGL